MKEQSECPLSKDIRFEKDLLSLNQEDKDPLYLSRIKYKSP